MTLSAGLEPGAPPPAARRGGALRRWLPVRVWPFAGLVAVMLALALAAPWLAPQDPNAQNLLGRLKPPGAEMRAVHYLLGTDELGRDLLSRLIYGARVSLMVAALAVLVSGGIGTMLGMLAAGIAGRPA